MAASFPNAKKTFSQLSDGITNMEGINVNTAYDEVEAVETFIGATGGGAQSYSESLKGLLGSYQRGCSVDYLSATELTVNIGEISILDASGNMRLRKNISAVTVTWAMIDTGAEAASTTYYIYAVADSAATTFTILISTNATTPTGATFYRKIGWFYNNSDSNIQDAVASNTFTGRMVCDTGWYAQAADRTVYHNFGTTRFNYIAYVAADASGISMQAVANFGVAGSSGYGAILDAITITTCNIEQGGNGIGNLDGNGTAATFTSGKYLRVILEAIN